MNLQGFFTSEVTTSYNYIYGDSKGFFFCTLAFSLLVK